MNNLMITSITNFMLASELFFFAGMMFKTPKTRYSAAWFWSFALLSLALAALIGGIDHGFFELFNQPRFAIQRFNWLVVGLVAFFALLTTARQFFPPKAQKFVLVLGVIQLVIYSFLVYSIGEYRVVILNYAPVMLLLLIMNFIGLKNETGSWSMIAGILILFFASGIQLAGVDTFSPVDRNGLYHLISMVGVVFLYLGGQRLKV